jgi:putative acyl-CoA dehydrogenase
LLVGEEGRGIREILSHAHLTRLDFAAGSAGLMRQALTLAISHAQSRTGFGRPMAELPMQANVLADLSLESEAAMLGALRVAAATDGIETDERERLFARVATPVMKFWNCQRAAYFVYECVQVHGGNGFIMENPMARLYREAPLNSIWEGTSNMMCLDVLRAMQREPGCRDAFMDELRQQQGQNATFDRAWLTWPPGSTGVWTAKVTRGMWSPGWPTCCRRPRCWPTAPRLWPGCTSRLAWAATGCMCTGRCRIRRTFLASWNGQRW